MSSPQIAESAVPNAQSSSFLKNKIVTLLPMSSTFPELYNKLIENRNTLYPIITILLALIPVIIVVAQSQITKLVKLTVVFIFVLIILLSIVVFRV